LHEQLGEMGVLPELLAYQGLACHGLGDQARALEFTHQAILSLAQGEVSDEVIPEIYYAHALALEANGEADQALAYLQRAYQHLLALAAQLEDEPARQAFFNCNPTLRRLMHEIYAREIALAPGAGVISRQVPSSRGGRSIQVRWTVDAGPPDTALKQAQGAIALRRARLARLLEEASVQGANPSPVQLAEVLGVSKRTIQRDMAVWRASSAEI
jgi:tetratricopeptide (TPR) repeat protein